MTQYNSQQQNNPHAIEAQQHAAHNRAYYINVFSQNVLAELTQNTPLIDPIYNDQRETVALLAIDDQD